VPESNEPFTMAPPPIASFLLRCDNSQLYNYAARPLLEFALLGYTDVAARLIAALNSYDFYHDSHHRLKTLWLLWDFRAKEEGTVWPEGEKQKVRDAVRERRRTKASGDRAGDETVTSDDVEKELGLIAQDFASKWYYSGKLTGSDRMVAGNPHVLDSQPTVEQKLDAAHEIIHSLETVGPSAKVNDIKSGLGNALDLVLSAQKDSEKQTDGGELNMRGAPTSEELLKWIAKSTGDKYYDLRYLTESRYVWKVLKTGASRELLNVDKEALSAFAEEVESAIIERLAHGRQQPAAHMSIEDLLKASQHNTQTNPAASGLPDQAKDASLFRDPATSSQLREAEVRLDTQLPEDYKAFLRLSNGFGATWGHALGDYEPPLHALSSLRWLDPATEDYFTDLTLDIPTRWDTWPFAPPPTMSSNYADDLEYFLVGRALEIGTEGIDNTWLVPPSTIEPIKNAIRGMLEDEQLGEREKQSVRRAISDFAGSEQQWEKMEWACVTWASGGTAAMYVHPSFKAYLEDVVVHGTTEDEAEKKAKRTFQSGVWLGAMFRNEVVTASDGELPEWLAEVVTRSS
jgi:hypothetical protein